MSRRLVAVEGGAGCNQDALAWEKLAATAEECRGLRLSADAYEALVRIEAAYRGVASMPAQSGRRLRVRSGADVLDEVVRVIEEGLHDVDPADPARGHLLRFLAAASPLRRALRVVHP